MAMTDQQTQIPMPVKKAAANATKQPETITKPNVTEPCFTILAALPWTFGDPMCCTQYRAEIWKDERDQYYVTYWHATDCEVWRFVP
jgi:hypothetical protein